MSTQPVQPVTPQAGILPEVIFTSPTKSASSPFAFPRPDDDRVRQANVMIIDDDQSTTVAIQKHLQLEGFSNCKIVTQSETAIDAIKALRPDLVLLDLMMPVNGLEILRAIRQFDSTCHIPVVTLTSNNDEETRATLLNFGANDFLQKPVNPSELVARVRNSVSAKLSFDDMVARSAQLQADVLIDSLTEVANRRAFDFELSRKMIEWERQRTPIALLVVDIDHFKLINDKFGHQIGDAVLKQVAEAIKQATRKMDLVCRIGGEEFAVILPVTRQCESHQAAERIRTKIEEMVVSVQSVDVKLTVSVGVANSMKGDDADLLFRRADTALYGSKQNGRNRSMLHDGARCVDVARSGNSPESNGIANYKEPVDANITACGVMIIDDEPSTVAVVKKYLSQGGFERLVTETDSRLAYERVERELPDLVLMDIRMPNVDGLGVLNQIRNGDLTRNIPVVFLTSSTDTETKVNALNLGANDFLHKPVNSSELLARVRNTLLAKAHMDLLEGYSSKLEHEVQMRTAELVASRREAIQCLARAAEMRDDKTGQHVLRVGRYAAIIAGELGFTPEQIVDLEHAAQLHDVGKIGVPDAILNKPDQLTDEEFEQIKDHCRAGSRIIRDDSMGSNDDSREQIGDFLDNCSSPVMRLAALVAETHHEKWDGSGYPRGLSGVNIPIEGRITAVCDVFDAVSTSRPYKKAFPLERCFQIILEGSGSHFDPDVVQAFFRRQKEVIEAFLEYSDESTKDTPITES